MFGCGESVGRGSFLFRDAVAEAVYPPQADRLRHMDGIDQDRLEAALDARGRARRTLLGVGGVLGLLAAVGPAFATFAEPRSSDPRAQPPATSAAAQTGRVHTVPSTSATVRLGVFDATLPNILDVDSGDVVVYPSKFSQRNAWPCIGVTETRDS